MELAGFLDATVCSGHLNNNRLAGDIDKLVFTDVTFFEGLMQLSCDFIEGDDVMPDSFAAVLRVDCKLEPGSRSIVSGAEPRVTSQPAAQLHRLYSLARL